MNFPIRVGKSKQLKIRGVIAERVIKKGEVIEVCPAIIYPNKYDKTIAKTPLGNYDFEWDEKHDGILLGYGSLYNHSYHPNAEFDDEVLEDCWVLRAIKNINKDEEITINYNGESDDNSQVEKKYLTFNKHLNK